MRVTLEIEIENINMDSQSLGNYGGKRERIIDYLIDTIISNIQYDKINRGNVSITTIKNRKRSVN